MDPGQGTRGSRGIGTGSGPVPKPSPQPIVLNCRVLTRPTITGVERWTSEVVTRLQALAPDRYLAAAPPACAQRRGRGQAWEQLALPWRAAREHAALIFSPANLAPLPWPRNVLVMHDAAVMREPGSYSPAYRAWHRRVGLACARRALAVITVSEFSRRELIETCGLDPERLVVIGGGVSDRFAPGAADERVLERLGLARPYVLTIATADPRKNLQALKLAAARLAQAGIDLVWAGDSRPYFSQVASLRGLRPLGYVDDRDLLDLYRGALAFVLPSRYEGFGLPCLEAMGCGIPVVAAARGALPETCGDAALLVDPDDAEATAESVMCAATVSAVRDPLRASGPRRARLHSWDHVAADTHALLVELADRRAHAVLDRGDRRFSLG